MSYCRKSQLHWAIRLLALVINPASMERRCGRCNGARYPVLYLPCGPHVPWRRIWGATERVMRTIPKNLVSKIERACSIELSSAPAGATLKSAYSRAVQAESRQDEGAFQHNK